MKTTVSLAIVSMAAAAVAVEEASILKFTQKEEGLHVKLDEKCNYENFEVFN